MTEFGYPPPNPYHDIKEHTMPEHFRKFVDTAGGFRWSLRSGNNEIVATSEAYTRADDRDRSIDTVYAIVRGLDTGHKLDREIDAIHEENRMLKDRIEHLLARLLVAATPPVDHQAARQEFARRATDRNPDGPDAA